MINKITSFFLCLFIVSNLANAQEYDEVSIGAGYSKQTFYKLSDGKSVSINNDAWDLCFSSSGQTDGGIFINESASSTGVPIKLFVAPSNDWASPIQNTDIFDDSVALYNPEVNWIEGAFNSVKNPVSPFDYGWGSYNPQTHTVEGNKIYVLKMRDESFKKIQIVSLAGPAYTFKYANLDGSNEVVKTINKGNTPLIYFSLKTNETVNVPGDYDLVFQRYSAYVHAPNDTTLFQQYTVVGALLGPGTQAVKASNVDVQAVKEEDYATKYTSNPTVIGHDWKDFDFVAGWVLKENLVYFVKTKSGERYKLVFVDFQGSATGTTTIERTYLGTTSSQTLEEASIAIFPNPTAGEVFIESENGGQFFIQDMGGKIIMNKKIGAVEMVDLSALPSGCYVYQFKDGNKIKTGKLIR